MNHIDYGMFALGLKKFYTLGVRIDKIEVIDRVAAVDVSVPGHSMMLNKQGKPLQGRRLTRLVTMFLRGIFGGIYDEVIITTKTYCHKRWTEADAMTTNAKCDAYLRDFIKRKVGESCE